MRFSANVGCHFLESINVGRHFCLDFHGFAQMLRDLPRFLTNQNFWGCACTPASYTTASTWLIKYKVFHLPISVQGERLLFR